jgi:DNA mismatch endonuclease (patch repair protein)
MLCVGNVDEPLMPEPVRASSPGVSSRMSQLRRRDTLPELRLRQALHAAGWRYRVNYPVPGLRRRSIDVAFTRWRVAVFVDGCFWHGCHAHRPLPAANRDWWREKIAKNVARDLDTGRHLRAEGWTVIRVWEHDSVDDATSRVEAAIRARERRPAPARLTG